MKFLRLLFAISLNHICSKVNCKYFCDRQNQNRLIDGLFNVNRTLYAFRKPYVWIIKDKSWTKDIKPILLSQLFPGIPMDSFQSGFSIIRYTDNIDDSGNPFHPNGITFLFRGNRYYISKYANERKFVPLTKSDMENVPWFYKETYGLVWRNNMALDGDINAAVYDHLAHIAYIVNNKAVTSYHLKSKRQDPIATNKNLPQNFIKGNGGVFDLNNSNHILYFANNNVWSYSGAFHSLNKTYWQYFQCDKFIPTETQTTIITKLRTHETNSTDLITSIITDTANDNNSLTISPAIDDRKPVNGTTEEKFNCFRKTRCIILIAVFIVVSIFAIIITVSLFILFRKNRSKNKKKIKRSKLVNKTVESDSNKGKVDTKTDTSNDVMIEK